MPLFLPKPRRWTPGAATCSFLALVLASCSGPRPSTEQPAESVKPGINERFKSSELDIGWALETFEGDSREVYQNRVAIVESLGIEPDMTVADVGAGTGFFLGLFVEAVGPGGSVWAIDISATLVEYMRKRVAEAGLENVRVVQGADRSAMLPEGEVDVVFVCDTYHHFEYPGPMLTSLHRALVPGGKLFILDFERVPGSSRDWILDHVRAGRAEVIAEVTAAGFDHEAVVPVDGLDENYLLRFRRS